MSLTSSYINNLYSNNRDLKEFYEKESNSQNFLLGTLEVLGKYITVTFGNAILSLSVSLTPIFIALDAIKALGKLFVALVAGDQEAEIFVISIVSIAFSILSFKIAFFTDSIELYNSIVDLWKQRNPLKSRFIDFDHPEIKDYFSKKVSERKFEAGMAAIYFFLIGTLCLIKLDLIDNRDQSYILGSLKNMSKVAKIALSILYPSFF
jgi:hypothetical protein